jgi:hypothetical protein
MFTERGSIIPDAKSVWQGTAMGVDARARSTILSQLT